MEDQTARQLLVEFRAFRDSEFRGFRNEFSDWKVETAERIGPLETQVKSGITGNGQPSRLAVLEAEVSKLNQFKFWLLGAAAAVGSAFGAGVNILISAGRH
jgi:hypothetical protein